LQFSGGLVFPDYQDEATAADCFRTKNSQRLEF
jgi:hypothetical protein